MTAFWIDSQRGQPDKVPLLCRLLAEHGINITFLTSTVIGDLQPALCCVEACDGANAGAYIGGESQLDGKVRIADRAAGLLSVYPHRASFHVLGAVLRILQDRQIAVHSLASSIAALTFVVDFECLETAVTALSEAWNIKNGQIVRQSEYRIKQTMPPGLEAMPKSRFTSPDEGQD